MKAAVVVEAGRPPVYRDFPDPVPVAGEVEVRMHAAALTTLAKSRASGVHYSSENQPPFVVGVDGVGELEDGRRVYFALPRAPYGSMSDRTVIRSNQVVTLPKDLDDVTAAAIANPGMSSWVAFKERAHLSAGENVLVNGATGTAGRLAVQIAKHLGARKVIATGRTAEALKTASAVGADVTIPLALGDEAFEQAVQEQFRGDGIDVVLDYLWGPSAERILAAGAKAAKEAVPIRFVHVGSLSASAITLPSAALRAAAIELMGSGIGSVPRDRIVHSIDELLQATVPAGFKVETRTLPLSEIERIWPSAETQPRIVFQIH
jgi:NADPH:quinone reductase-like Zn-dependent oxidoreductase